MAKFAKGTNKRNEQLMPGTSYLIMEARPYLSYTLFQSVVKGGRSGLIMTRQHPSKLGEYGLGDITEEIYWMCTTEGEKCVSSTDIGEINRLFKEFAEDNEESVLLLDGFEYLMVNNGFGTVLRLMQKINESVVKNDSILIMPASPHSFSEQELALLCREMFLLESPLSYELQSKGVDMSVQ